MSQETRNLRLHVHGPLDECTILCREVDSEKHIADALEAGLKMRSKPSMTTRYGAEQSLDEALMQARAAIKSSQSQNLVAMAVSLEAAVLRVFELQGGTP